MKVFYHPNQNVSDNSSFSPSAGKPFKVASQWSQLFPQVELVTGFKPLTRSMISLAHSTDYVHNVLSCKTPNGFGNTKQAVADSLPWTTGSFVASAVYSYRTKSISASLTSGFHHACYDHGGGFCTFNGLVIAAQILKVRYGLSRVGIIDFDQHYGDGTEQIIQKLSLNYIVHYTLGGTNVTSNSADNWLDTLEDKLFHQFAQCSVILYQAGADPFINDPLGGRLTKEQMRRRDEIVFKVAKRLNIGVAWNLAGGYTDVFQHVLDIHNNTMIEALKASGQQTNVPLALDDITASNGQKIINTRRNYWDDKEDDGFVSYRTPSKKSYSNKKRKSMEDLTDAELSEYIAELLEETPEEQHWMWKKDVL
jgi:acetoin utilization deacetylase AcuC-like enzyme